MSAVCNAGPLIALGKIGGLELLPAVFECVIIPLAVYAEVVDQGISRGRADALAVREAIHRGHLVTAELNVGEVTPDLAALPLDTGEKQVLHVAIARGIRMVLLDDLRAREEARQRSLSVCGTLGVILRAYRENVVSRQRGLELVQAIRDRSDIWIADQLCARAIDALIQV